MSKLSFPEKITLFFSITALILSGFTFYKNYFEGANVDLYTGDTVYITIGKDSGPRPYLNLMCNLVNSSTKLGTVHRLEAHVTGPSGTRNHFVWKLFFKYAPGGQIVRKEIDPHPIAIPGRDSKFVLIQFEGDEAIRDRWVAGSYEFEMIGWVNRKHRGESVNLRTVFHINISKNEARWLNHWETASEETWRQLNDPDNAVGVPIKISEWSESTAQ